MSDERDVDRDAHDRREDLLDALIEDASWSAELDLDHADELAPPSFASIIARAHRLDPAEVPRGWVPAEHAELLDMMEQTASKDADEDPLARFIEAAREEAEDDIRGHIALVGDAPAPSYVHAQAPRRRVGLRIGAVMGALAAAAAVALFIGQLAAPDATLQRQPAQRFFQSVIDLTFGRDAQEGTTRALVEAEEAKPARSRRARRPSQASDDDLDDELLDAAAAPDEENERDESDDAGQSLLEERAPDELLCPDDAPQDEPAPPQDEPAPQDETTPRATPTLRQQLTTLDRDAELALRSGALEEADAAYREIIRRGGRHRLVELAYAERFTLARRAGDQARRLALWREYLRRFPRGRFGEDARAGLCRLESTRAADCWRDYLARHPDGTYASQARRALDSADASTADVPSP